MIEENDERLLRDRILHYTYWFYYMEVDQYVELKGSDFAAEHVRVEYSVVSMYCMDSMHCKHCLQVHSNDVCVVLHIIYILTLSASHHFIHCFSWGLEQWALISCMGAESV